MTKMTEKKKSRKAIAHSKLVGVGELMPIIDQQERWSECTLENGTKLRIRPIIVEVRKEKALGTDGRPQYSVKTSILTDAQHPESHKERGSK